MTGRVVCDASVIVAMLLDSGVDGRWSTQRLSGADLFAPSLLQYECANIIRRQELSGSVSADQAAQAHADLLDLDVNSWPYELLSGRAWQLRPNLSIYDATYVALAEAVETELVTLDRRIARAPGVKCTVVCPSQP
jgi:predicted nucleic acid-binding protein